MNDIDVVFSEIRAELERQDKKWGGLPHDRSHRGHEWVAILAHRVGKLFEAVEWDAGRRRRLVQIAAVAVAAIRAGES